ncbi:flavin reductase family protein [Marinimicrobium alkaliphilum]|uniref:flavin reductase family protein n=1 Tax=Marinimicrobium alkaliphilum TaxID=2202654 RepID=UPI000DB9A039|nr:flavin reductase family protein [Marinimicrobium alkaliphilum]
MDSRTPVSRAEIDAMDPRFRVQFINSLSGFKSLNLVGTVDADGRENLAIVSSVIHLGANPPLMAMVTRPRSVERHTVDNLMATGVFTLNHVRPDFVEAAHQTSARYPREQSEFAQVGLTPWYSGTFPAPYVAESALRIGLRWRESKLIELNDTELIIGEIDEVHLDQQAWRDDGSVDLEALD